MNKWLKIGAIVSAVVVGVAALGIAVLAFMPNPVSAQVQTFARQRMAGPAAFGGPAGQFGRMGNFDRGGWPGQFGDKIDREALLADALGITVDELRAAQKQADTAAIQQALDEGLISQDQANAMLAHIQLRDYIDRDALTAKALGISTEELQAARDEGKPLPVLIYEQGLDPATMRTNMQNAMQELVQQAVADGVISQEQADQLLKGPAAGFGRGGFGGPRGGGPRGGGFGPW